MLKLAGRGAVRVLFGCIVAASIGGCINSGTLYQVSQAKAAGDDVEFVLQPYQRVDYLFPAPPGGHVEPHRWHVTATVPTRGKLVPTLVTRDASPDPQYTWMRTPDWATAQPRRDWRPARSAAVPPDFELYASQSAGGRNLVLYRKPYPERLILVDFEADRAISEFAPDKMVLSDWDSKTGRLVFSPQSFPAQDTLRLAVWDPLQGWARVFKPSSGDVEKWVKTR